MEHTQRVEDTHRAESAQAAAPRPRGVPSDWFLDPADPLAGADAATLEDQATALLSAHDLEDEAGTPSATVTALFPGDAGRPVEAAPVADDWVAIAGLVTEPVEGELAWQVDALCAQTDPEAFFPEKGGSTRDAKRVCEACVVKDQCLEYAMENDERFGIWGGLSERERRRLRRARA
ncbi:WhiB family transcriptional regulator [Micrococcus endophyticus]|uniref:Transcriptional regulator WhiB n=1 Tax=Micrococcus endophyticus TaxID=455343 RepID=A0A7W9N0J8_9MICC|nr:WhiB family transcriptional regulator [Micrococcus endophyticus]MBB5848833.1 WhiB family redox-sensing transcriptional regulator [Micrococcus endophyticus]